MPSTLLTFAAAETRCRWFEPYVTEGLNAKLAANTPPGVYRGFRLTTSQNALTVKLAADPAASDHVAVVETADPYSLTVRKGGGDFELDLQALVGQDVVLAIYVTYVIGQNTSAILRAYTINEYNALSAAARRALCVLGRVVVPGNGIIPGANLSLAPRSSAWRGLAQEAAPWTPLLRNGGFEIGPVGSLLNHRLPFWTSSVISNAYAVVIDTAGANAYAGSGSLLLTVVTPPVQANGEVHQALGMPVYAEQQLRLEAHFRLDQQLSAGEINLVVEWGDKLGTDINTPSKLLLADQNSNPDGIYYLKSKVVLAPANARSLRRIYLEFDGAEFQGNNAACHIDDVQAWLEPHDARTVPFEEQRRAVAASLLTLEGPQTTPFDGNALLLEFDPSFTTGAGGKVVAGARWVNNLPPLLQWLGRMILGPGVFNAALDDLPRLDIPTFGGSRRIALARFGGENNSTADSGVRLYLSPEEGLEIAANCYWDTAAGKWKNERFDANGSRAVLYVFGSVMANVTSNDLTIKVRNFTVADEWTDAQWDFDALRFSGPTADRTTGFGTVLELRDGLLELFTPTTDTYGSNLPFDSGGFGSNRLFAKSIPKGWGYVEIVNGVIVANSREGLNYALSFDGNGRVVITFNSNMNSTKFAVHPTLYRSSNGDYLDVSNWAQNYVELTLRDKDGVAKDIVAGNLSLTFSWIVFGVQT